MLDTINVYFLPYNCLYRILFAILWSIHQVRRDAFGALHKLVLFSPSWIILTITELSFMIKLYRLSFNTDPWGIPLLTSLHWESRMGGLLAGHFLLQPLFIIDSHWQIICLQVGKQLWGQMWQTNTHTQAPEFQVWGDQFCFSPSPPPPIHLP